MSNATAIAVPNNNHLTAEWLGKLTEHNMLCWQHGENNVGLLLPVLLEVNGWQGDVLSLVDALPVTVSQVTITHLLSVMSSLGYKIYQEKRRSTDLRSEDMPALFVPNNSNGWLSGWVFKEIGPYGVIWDNGRTTTRGNVPDEVGILYRFERMIRSEDDEPVIPREKWLSQTIGRFKPLFLQLALLSFALYFFTLLIPIYSMVVYDRVISIYATDTLFLITIGVLGGLMVEMVIRWLRVIISGWIAARSSLIVTQGMFERLLYLPSTVIEQASVSSQLARIKAFESVRDFISSAMFLAFFEIPFTLALLVIIAIIAGDAVWVLIGTLAAYVILLLAMRPHWQRLSLATGHFASRRQHILMEILDNRKEIFIEGLSERMRERFRIISWQAVKSQKNYNLVASSIQYAALFLGIIAGVVMINFCLHSIWAGQMAASAMVATMILSWRILFPLQTLCAIIPYFEQIAASTKQITQLMRMVPESHAEKNVLPEKMLEGKITFQNVSLRYSRKSDPVFYGLNAEIKKGQIAAIVGGNGSGKSSILKLLLGLYLPASGVIRLDGVDHRQFDPRQLRRQIAYLPQSLELMPGTVSEILRVMDPMAAEYKLRQALLWADAWEMVEALPAGLNTLIGEGGVIPSSGLAARLGLARLYLSERPIILCDEMPPSIMNSSSGERFKRYLLENKGKKTIIFVANRDDWLSLADQVIFIQPSSIPIAGKPSKKLLDRLQGAGV